MTEQTIDVKYFPLLREFKAIQDKGCKFIFSASHLDNGAIYSPDEHLIIISSDITISKLYYALERLAGKL